MNLKERGQKMLAMGRTKFILKYGVCGWGLLTAVLFLAFQIVSEKRYSLTALIASDFLKQLLSAILLFLVAGYFWGLFMWTSLTKKMQNKK